MKKIQIKLIDKRLGKDFPMPHYATEGSAGLDLCACTKKTIEINSNETILISAGFAIYIADKSYAAMLLPRSGIGHKNGIVLGNLTGLIDSDYQGPLSISLWNRSSEPIEIDPGERVAQLVVIRVDQVELDLVEEFETTERGSEGFGSTGVS